MQRFEATDMPVKVYHPAIEKARTKVAGMANMQVVDLHQLAETDYVLLALPAGKAGELVEMLQRGSENGADLPVLINLSTKDRTAELRKHHPAFCWMGIKLAGHAKALEQEGNGLFVSQEWQAYPEVAQCFRRIGEVAEGSEEDVLRFNSQVTEAAVASAVKLKEQLKQANFDNDWIRHALTCSFPQVVKAYEQDELGTFAKEVAEKVREDKSSQ
ncbi:hypothetical protein [Salisediminibacterium beveridgei]|uniref:Pyrroline-5-carboxylate reductase catalytic N-terminal domain-containing protein n=1 Tax=Salisediminibacterium beveridgei TaxID=632773 RepID=A0A1D7QS74_9BACI|nr:hypothetical protein [Salisediminibacterium beveridgei]AOM81857.1 hypothetical protein BBEV_0463 [Salisediminibacterium beveridgei]